MFEYFMIFHTIMIHHMSLDVMLSSSIRTQMLLVPQPVAEASEHQQCQD